MNEEPTRTDAETDQASPIHATAADRKVLPGAWEYEGYGRKIRSKRGVWYLRVERPTFGKTATIAVDGHVVARPPRASLENPWVECLLPGRDEYVDVVQVQRGPENFIVLVFINWVGLDDGVSIDDWRANKPVAKDRFEQTWFDALDGKNFFGSKAITGLVAAAVAGARMRDDFAPNLQWAAAFALIFVVVAAWVTQARYLADWLRTERDLSWRLRNLIMVADFILFPVVAMAIIFGPAPSN